ncbi:hypothetical protein CDAR_53351 [Caerostris darwini]|uniref:Uncharacterized protein n=1 Tax=Caerostris darwini TaxID=1538125 RepID=A0AAV4TI18_9ARAC|nr:hypothetical protein CDAR_53351 [Caerostris darwini]
MDIESEVDNPSLAPAYYVHFIIIDDATNSTEFQQTIRLQDRRKDDNKTSIRVEFVDILTRVGNETDYPQRTTVDQGQADKRKLFSQMVRRGLRTPLAVPELSNPSGVRKFLENCLSTTPQNALSPVTQRNLR